MVQVFLHNSTLTPAPAGYASAVEKALTAAGATLGEAGEVSLAGRVVLAIQLDLHDDIALIELDQFDDAVLDLVFDLAGATASFVVMAGAICATPSTGQVPPAWSMGFESSGTVERADFRAWLASDIETQKAEHARLLAIEEALAKARAERDARPAKPLFNRLTDALFGKPI